ncbi:S8 family serine peptidase [Candidatus Dojkabacteria bacterium]|jgi:hypothetical protein|nr:S8 family serine peptidase [Candidatus Dojkabacteria bacterium]
MKKLITFVASLFLTLILSFICLESNKYSYASSLASPSFSDRVPQLMKDLKQSKKIALSSTLAKDEKDIVAGEYIVGVEKDLAGEILNYIQSNYKASVSSQNISSTPNVTYIFVKLFDKKTTDFVSKVYGKEGVLYIENNVKRYSQAVPTLNDPLLPISNSFADANTQWYLNRPEGGNFGIDVQRAWAYLDGIGVNWGGSNDVTVAVIDSGVAFENYSKYATYENMVTPTAWEFGKATDMVTSIFTNSGEVADNGLDDDGFGIGIYCVDENADRICDDIAGSIYDDVHGVNLFDWYAYWTPDSGGSYCLDSNPNDDIDYTQFLCIPNRLCEDTGYNNPSYFGCEESDMGHANDTFGHGTFVSNVIAGAANNGVAGVGISPNVKIMPIRVIGDYWNGIVWEDNVGSSLVTSFGIMYAVNSGANIINLSVGGASGSLFESIIIDYAEDSNVVVVASSGNAGASSVLFPAAYSSVIAVGASNMDGSKTTYSNYGSNLDIVAPVEEAGIINQSYTCYFTSNCLTNSEVLSIPSQFTQFSTALSAGTSFSAPQVSAAAALIKSAHPLWNAWQIRQALVMGAVPVSPDGKPNVSIGFGVLNVYNSVRGVDYLGRDIFSRQMDNVVQNRLFETKQKSNKYIYYRVSDDGGLTKSSWFQLSHRKTYSGSAAFSNIITVSSFDADTGEESLASRILVTYVGDNKTIYTKYSDNGGATWSSLYGNGSTTSSVATVVVGETVVQTTRYNGGKYNNHVRTRVSVDAGEHWSAWTGPTKASSIATNGAPSMVYVPSTGTIVQTVLSTNGASYLRYSSNLGSTWSAWARQATTVSGPSLVLSGTNLYFTVIGSKGKILSRVSSDGGITWGAWYSNGVSTNGSIYTSPDKVGGVVQAIKWSNKHIYIRSTLDGITWTSWVRHKLPSKTTVSSGVKLVNTEFGLYLSAVASNKYLYTKYSTDNGVTWSAWQKAYSSSTSYGVIYDSVRARLFEFAKRTNNYLYSRYSDDGGVTWSGLVKDSSTSSSVELSLSPIDFVNIDW